MMSDIFGVAGIALLTLGVYVRFGWDIAAIIGGIILLALAVTGAMRR